MPFALPLAWKIGGIAILIVMLAGGYAAWTYHQREIGAAKVIAADAEAVARQKAKDAETSARLVNELEAKNRALEASAAQVREVIRYVPVTSSCGPAVGSAAKWVRDNLTPQTGGSPAGR